MSIDHVLKLYSETLRSSYLHYGFWDKPDTIDFDTVTIQDIKNAQQRYIEHLRSFIPEDTNSILDVVCGIGGNTEFLLNQGFKVETLSPDNYQKSVISKKFNNKVRFHHCKFEKFAPEISYDLILQSESVCYIKIEQGFLKSREALRNGGYILASDYFIYNNDNSNNPHLKSSHDLEKYLRSAESHGFKLIKEFDQTENTMPTLDYGDYFIKRFINPTLEYGLYSAKKNYPKATLVIQKIIKSKLKNKLNQLDLIDSALFRKHRKYMIFLFKKIDV